MRIIGGLTRGTTPPEYEVTTATHVREVLGERTRLPYEIVEESTWRLTSGAVFHRWPRWQYGQQPGDDWSPIADDPGATLIDARFTVHVLRGGEKGMPSARTDRTEEDALRVIARQDAIEHVKGLIVAERWQVTRECYERLCAAIGATPIADADLYRSLQALDATDPGHRFLAAHRGERAHREADEARRAERERAETERRHVPAPRRACGSGGVRYDERCELCGRVGEVDNGTGLCQRHGGAA